MGIACHIYSAAPNGPRGQGGKTPEFLSSEANGLWCCSYHGNLIDKGSGVDYPDNVLFAWKALIEARAAKEMNDQPSPLGWVSSIEIKKFPGMKKSLAIDLSRFTLLAGTEASGKTVLLELAAGTTDTDPLNRFTRSPVNGAIDPIYHVSGQIIYSTVDAHERSIDVLIEGEKITRRLDDTAISLPTRDLAVIACLEPIRARTEDEDDCDYLKNLLKVDDASLKSLISNSENRLLKGDLSFTQGEEDVENEFGEEITRKMKKSNGDAYLKLTLSRNIRGETLKLPLDSLSRSERSLIIIQLFLEKARNATKDQLTLLVIDGFTSPLDFGNFSNLLDAIEKIESQAIVTAPPLLYAKIMDRSNTPPKLLLENGLQNWKLCWLEHILQA